MSRRRRAVRAIFAAVLLTAVATVGYSYGTTQGVFADSNAQAAPTGDDGAVTTTGRLNVDLESRFDRAREGRAQGVNWSTTRVSRAVSRTDRNLSVVATQGFYVTDERAELAAFLPNGTLVYYNDSYRVYFDVDPVPGTRYTVEYVAAAHYGDETCQPVGGEPCTRNVVERVNLTTGAHETVYSELTPRLYSARWHDVDRINETHLVVADIVDDGVYAVDTRDGEVEWRWDAADHYNRSAGGKAGDWTHINDVELLADGRIMVSPRNMDEVIFLERTPDGWAVDADATLGTDDDHSVLYEQHNPDYIPPRLGGPNVLVADSENGRIVEYHRTDGGYERVWTWRDVRLQWPRDADRLPNGNTFVVDSHGDRVVEVGPENTVVWSADVGMPYDVERLGTGDESAGGPAAPYRRAVRDSEENATTVIERVDAGAAESVSAVDRSIDERFWLALKGAVPPLIANGLLYVAPSWVRFSDLAFAAVAVGTGVTWGSVEFYWSRFTLRGAGRRLRGAVGRVVGRAR